MSTTETPADKNEIVVDESIVDNINKIKSSEEHNDYPEADEQSKPSTQAIEPRAVEDEQQQEKKTSEHEVSVTDKITATEPVAAIVNPSKATPVTVVDGTTIDAADMEPVTAEPYITTPSPSVSSSVHHQSKHHGSDDQGSSQAGSNVHVPPYAEDAYSSEGPSGSEATPKLEVVPSIAHRHGDVNDRDDTHEDDKDGVGGGSEHNSASSVDVEEYTNNNGYLATVDEYNADELTRATTTATPSDVPVESASITDDMVPPPTLSSSTVMSSDAIDNNGGVHPTTIPASVEGALQDEDATATLATEDATATLATEDATATVATESETLDLEGKDVIDPTNVKESNDGWAQSVTTAIKSIWSGSPEEENIAEESKETTVTSNNEESEFAAPKADDIIDDYKVNETDEEAGVVKTQVEEEQPDPKRAEADQLNEDEVSALRNESDIGGQILDLEKQDESNQSSEPNESEDRNLQSENNGSNNSVDETDTENTGGFFGNFFTGGTEEAKNEDNEKTVGDIGESDDLKESEHDGINVFSDDKSDSAPLTGEPNDVDDQMLKKSDRVDEPVDVEMLDVDKQALEQQQMKDGTEGSDVVAVHSLVDVVNNTKTSPSLGDADSATTSHNLNDESSSTVVENEGDIPNTHESFITEDLSDIESVQHDSVNEFSDGTLHPAVMPDDNSAIEASNEANTATPGQLQGKENEVNKYGVSSSETSDSAMPQTVVGNDDALLEYPPNAAPFVDSSNDGYPGTEPLQTSLGDSEYPSVESAQVSSGDSSYLGAESSQVSSGVSKYLDAETPVAIPDDFKDSAEESTLVTSEDANTANEERAEMPDDPAVTSDDEETQDEGKNTY